MKSWRELANQYRAIPLERVVAQAGGIQDRHDRQKWHTPNGFVWLGTGSSSQKFFDHTAGVGGGGAIDLVQYILQVDFKSAVAWLHENFGTSHEPVRQRVPVAKPLLVPDFQEPRRAPQLLAHVLAYLTAERAIPASLVKELVKQGKIFADAKRNAIFLCEFGGKITGAEIRGTGSQAYKGMSPGSQRGAGFFTVSHPKPMRLVVVESAIDALSYHALHPQGGALIASTAGVMPDCPKLLDLAQFHGTPDIAIAYDSDDAGESNAEKLIASLTHSTLRIQRERPLAKDWNNVLQRTMEYPLCQECA
ncbi:DUF3991 domain-containing protein [Sulfuriferula sp. GW1]|uniref:DUF3991 domain-containing protein n=1 Tax=Sulfuriferula sp. GW1 TaxID=3345111 RepID=UPI0039AF9620